MTGPEHYRLAEKFLADSTLIEENVSKVPLSESKAYVDASARAIATAQVHATLALAAATYDSAHELREPHRRAWMDALSWPS